MLFDVAYFLTDNLIVNTTGIPPECLQIYLDKFPEVSPTIGCQGKIYDGKWSAPVLDKSVK